MTPPPQVMVKGYTRRLRAGLSASGFGRAQEIVPQPNELAAAPSYAPTRPPNCNTHGQPRITASTRPASKQNARSPTPPPGTPGGTGNRTGTASRGRRTTARLPRPGAGSRADDGSHLRSSGPVADVHLRWSVKPSARGRRLLCYGSSKKFSSTCLSTKDSSTITPQSCSIMSAASSGPSMSTRRAFTRSA
jgi:hypothetical protein